MLILAARPGERIRLRVGDQTIWVRVHALDRRIVRLAFDAPPEVVIVREELLERVRDQRGRIDVVTENGTARIAE